MAAILVPSPHHPVDRPRRPDLRVVPGGAAGRPALAPPYGRRRVVAALLAVALVAVLLTGARALLAPLAEPAPAGPAAASAAPAGEAVVVRDGDTFWSLARRVQPEGDIRPLVDRLVAAHGAAPLRSGDRITLPTD